MSPRWPCLRSLIKTAVRICPWQGQLKCVTICWPGAMRSVVCTASRAMQELGISLIHTRTSSWPFHSAALQARPVRHLTLAFYAPLRRALTHQLTSQLLACKITSGVAHTHGCYQRCREIGRAPCRCVNMQLPMALSHLPVALHRRYPHSSYPRPASTPPLRSTKTPGASDDAPFPRSACSHSRRARCVHRKQS
ncbi:hypothetical protein HYPSUDRAFT_1055036 [Hypholoma sublateritium FD-334 SS-4]|uniref:Uncharacterized protein n=1 Tax=Hypholoma sublateritium (strain FD-334 SS-4) TaxID=945553 RepID=A0A0D2NJT5_HYPSF|nr:hypothetical protein HYPSUDRAFT_1055036 [Hypholoma sublateritium FD-334 SS-4]